MESLKRGLFVVLEGLDGAGTTTQQAAIGRYLDERDTPHQLTFEPTDRPVGVLLRDAIDGRLKLDERTMALLFAADRQDHCFGPGGINERLEAGEHVICDRYILSSLAYQAESDSDLEWLVALHRKVLDVDVTIYLDTTPDVAHARIEKRGGLVEDRYQNSPKLNRVYANYRRLVEAGEHVGRLYVVNGDAAVSAVTEQICEILESELRASQQSAGDPRTKAS